VVPEVKGHAEANLEKKTALLDISICCVLHAGIPTMASKPVFNKDFTDVEGRL